MASVLVNGSLKSAFVFVERYSYDVFGLPTIRDANGVILTTSGFGNRFMFTGREYDNETGLYYYRARFYNPHIGRFMQTDPIGYAGGLNLYTYVDNNPINWIDPWGLISSMHDPRNAALAQECLKGLGCETGKQVARAGARKTAADLAREGMKHIPRWYSPKKLWQAIAAAFLYGAKSCDMDGDGKIDSPSDLPQPKTGPLPPAAPEESSDESIKTGKPKPI